MPKIYSYILKCDSGAAPNPFWGICTLTICKPAIRRTAKICDWIIGTGSKRVKLEDGKYHDFSSHLVYAMKISNKLTLTEYDSYCRQFMKNKIPKRSDKDWKKKLGDCIYDYSKMGRPRLRKSVHNNKNMKRDLGGEFALMSDHFYYFGRKVRPFPGYLKQIVKKTQGHLRIENEEIIRKFIKWISRFKKNKVYADPQLLFELEKKIVVNCSERDNKDDKKEKKTILC
jgi:hypothetical protein